MEDGPATLTALSSNILEHINNGVVSPKMANFPEGTVGVSKEEKINNSHKTEEKVNGNISSEEYISDTDTDALIIDESVPKKVISKKRNRKRNKSKTENNEEVDKEINLEPIIHSNPFFNESLFELSQQHQEIVTTTQNCKVHKKHKRVVDLPKVKGKGSHKLREYAQYLGLQPAVQFKCSKCRKAGFESLSSLNEHLINCSADPNLPIEKEENSVSSFKLTRRVFLCSACGTYYENWNLYMHMLEFHRRFICLYCLGMFSALEDLCTHIQSKHNCEPGHKDTPDDFFNTYNEPCYLVCCECKKLFNEQDNFFYHECIPNPKLLKNKPKAPIRPQDHVTGDFNSDNCVALQDKIEMLQENHTGEKENPLVSLNKEFKENVIEKESDLPDQIKDFIATETNDNKCQDVSQEIFENQEYNEGITEDLSSKNFSSKLIKEVEENSRESSKSSDDIKLSIEESNSLKDEMSNEFQGINHLEESSEAIETRKVPKLSLKLPKSFKSYDQNESDDSGKITMEVDQIESENESINNNVNNGKMEDDLVFNEEVNDNQVMVAGQEIGIVELELEQPLDKFDIRVLLQRCLSATVPYCIYCNHARKIAVNGRQLGLHAISQHRYSAIVNSITAEELIPESFVSRIKESLEELEMTFFNLESNPTDEAVTFSHVFECFQCRYTTSVHKELYLHNRKMHAKNLLLCIMCKSNFYSYSELLCHLCPGVYILDYDLKFRCCMCVSDDLPSAFRLMVHLRKRHHVCDVCLEMCNNQYKLSNHVWKHKLHHFCYRCGIAYRNKLDITRHLFWKHGTESVLCKKCLQKKWPHVYHFCMPPTVFICEECNLSFSRAVYLKVHKRIHTNENPYACSEEGCLERFISKRLLNKHEKRHYEQPEEDILDNKEEPVVVKEDENNDIHKKTTDEDTEETEEKPKPKVDVYDLPELNLSESDSDSDDEKSKKQVNESETKQILNPSVNDELLNTNNTQNTLDSELKAPISESIWDDFKIYQATKNNMKDFLMDSDNTSQNKELNHIEEKVEQKEELPIDPALHDHDYCIINNTDEIKNDTNTAETINLVDRVDHDYCTPNEENKAELEKKNEEDKKIEEDKVNDKSAANSKKDDSHSSSSDSDSSSCSCGSNCSCSSSSDSSSSSSDSSDSESSSEEGRKRQLAKKQMKEKKKAKLAKKELKVENETASVPTEKPIPVELPVLELDLESTESETDEEFYDKDPLKLAKKMLEEKRNQLIAEAGTILNGGFDSRTSTPSLPEEVKIKKKSKSKKRKKRKSERREHLLNNEEYSNFGSTPLNNYQPTVAPLTISLNKSNNVTSQPISVSETPISSSFYSSMRQDKDPNLRASKRRRVPNKFYGYSSDEEMDNKPPQIKFKRLDILPPSRPPSGPPSRPPQQLLVPPITIRTTTPQPTVEPITIRPTAKPGELKVLQKSPMVPPLIIPNPYKSDSGSDSNDSVDAVNEVPVPPPEPPKKNVQLYCYCRCPYDEVSEMIGCDSHDCAIEWFHFECVGIMVPPKGQWFCPDCRKKKQAQRKDFLHV